MKVFFVLWIGLSVALPTWAKSDGEYIAQFLIAVKKGTTLQGNFIQKVVDTSGKKYPETKGKFFVKRPGKFLWQYAGASGQKIVSTGKRVWIEQPDLKQVANVSIKQAMRASPAAILFNPANIGKQFKITPERNKKSAGLEWVQLSPYQKKDMRFEKLTVGLQGQTIKEVQVLDSFGRTIVITFLGLQYNPVLSDTLFRYQPPNDFDAL